MAEAALACCKVVLVKGRLAHASQFLEVLERFAAIIPLDRGTVTEEVETPSCVHAPANIVTSIACMHGWCMAGMLHG